MKIAVLAEAHKHPLLRQLLEGPELSAEATLFRSYDDFLAEIPEHRWDTILIAQDGACGMESARAAVILQPQVPLVWLSDDKGFGPESYRIGCRYFSAAPITGGLLQAAFRKCN